MLAVVRGDQRRRLRPVLDRHRRRSVGRGRPPLRPGHRPRRAGRDRGVDRAALVRRPAVRAPHPGPDHAPAAGHRLGEHGRPGAEGPDALPRCGEVAAAVPGGTRYPLPPAPAGCAMRSKRTGGTRRWRGSRCTGSTPPIPYCCGTTMPWSHAVVSCAAEAVSAPVPRAGSWTRTAAHRCGEQGRSGASGWAAVRLGS